MWVEASLQDDPGCMAWTTFKKSISALGHILSPNDAKELSYHTAMAWISPLSIRIAARPPMPEIMAKT